MKSKIIILVVSFALTTNLLRAASTTFEQLAQKVDAQFQALAGQYKLTFVKKPNTMVAANLMKVASYINKDFQSTPRGTQSRMVEVYAPIVKSTGQNPLLIKINELFENLSTQESSSLVINKTGRPQRDAVMFSFAKYKNPQYDPQVQTLIALPEEYTVYYLTTNKIQRPGKYFAHQENRLIK